MKRQTGLVSFIDVGCAVYSKSRRRAGGGDGELVGGLVVGVTEELDRETGEVERSFLVFDLFYPAYLRWAVIPESDVDRDTIEALDVSVLCRAWRRLGKELAFTGAQSPRKGPATPSEVRIARAILELQAVVFGRDGVYAGALEAPATPIEAPMPTVPANVSALVD